MLGRTQIRQRAPRRAVVTAGLGCLLLGGLFLSKTDFWRAPRMQALQVLHRSHVHHAKTQLLERDTFQLAAIGVGEPNPPRPPSQVLVRRHGDIWDTSAWCVHHTRAPPSADPSVAG